MAHVLVRQRVEDFDAWKALFDGDAELRGPAGSLGGQVFQSAEDPNEIFVLLAWDSLENMQAFTQSEDLKERMSRAGVTGPPEISYLHLADSPSV